MLRRGTTFWAGTVIIAFLFFCHLYSVRLPDFLVGLGYGIGIALELIGLYHVKHESRFRRYKIQLFKKISGR